MKCPSFSFLSWLRAVKRFAPNDIPISAKRFFILSRMIFRLAHKFYLLSTCWFQVVYSAAPPALPQPYGMGLNFDSFFMP